MARGLGIGQQLLDDGARIDLGGLITPDVSAALALTHEDHPLTGSR